MSQKNIYRHSLMIVISAVFFAMPIQASAQSEADCAARADRAAREGPSTTGSVTRGALGGAAFGAIVGDSSKAAGRGAALGGIVGGVRNKSRDNQTYKRVYDDCMAGR